jgi:hypothetical protein
MRVLENTFRRKGLLEEATDSFLRLQVKGIAVRLSEAHAFSKGEASARRSASGSGDRTAMKTTAEHAGGRPETKIVRLTERERYYPIKGWSHDMLPTDPSAWETEDDNTDYRNRDDVVPPPGWAWASPWTLSDGGDKDHWE